MKFHPSKPYQKYWERLESWQSKTATSFAYRNGHTSAPIVGNKKACIAYGAISLILANSCLTDLDDRASTLFETIGTKIHWLAVFPAAKVITFIYNTPRCERYQSKHIALALKLRRLPSGFDGVAFRYLNRAL